jgi:hypothetical protein
MLLVFRAKSDRRTMVEKYEREELLRLLAEDGSLPACTNLGGYPIVYFDKYGETYCPECASSNLNAEVSGEDSYSQIVMGTIYWEGPPLICSECFTEIESAYGDPDDQS